jgi:DNA-binding SARP family transcriptional activator
MGVVRVDHQGFSAENSMGRAVKALLGYLTLFRHRFHAREVLAGIFWGDSSDKRARSCLSTTLWRLRKILEPDHVPAGTYLVTTSTGEIGFNNESDHWLDVAVFENQVNHVLAKPYKSLESVEAEQVEEALSLYKGELLEEFYDEWALRERERLRSLYLSGQIQLMNYYRYHSAYELGLACARNILNIDPLREEIHREMMRIYCKCGQRTQALKQYETCIKILDSELGVPPMEETQILYEQISQKSDNNHLNPGSKEDTVTAQKVLTRIQQTLHDFEKSAEQLQQSARALEKAMVDKRSGDRRLKTDDRRQRTEDRRQGTDDRRQMTDVRRQISDDRRQMTDVRKQMTDVRKQMTDSREQQMKEG